MNKTSSASAKVSLIRNLISAIDQRRTHGEVSSKLCAAVLLSLQIDDQRNHRGNNKFVLSLLRKDRVLAEIIDPDLSNDRNSLECTVEFEITPEISLRLDSKESPSEDLRHAIQDALDLRHREIDALGVDSTFISRASQNLKPINLKRLLTTLHADHTLDPLKASLQGLIEVNPPDPTWDVRANWVWTTASRIGDGHSGILMFVPRGEDSNLADPRLVNPQGDQAIVHRALDQMTSVYRPDWQKAEDWRIPDKEKLRFEEHAQSRKHIIYYPITDRLALQVLFNITDDFPEGGMGWALSMQKMADYPVRSSFFEAMSQVVRDIYSEASNVLSDPEYGRNRMVELLNQLVEIYPVPRVEAHTTRTHIEFSGTAHDPNSTQFAESANNRLRAITARVEADEARRVYYNLGQVSLGVTHTVNRRSNRVQTFSNRVQALVESIENDEHRIRNLELERVRDLAQEINRDARVRLAVGELDKRAVEQITSRHLAQACNTATVLDILAETGYLASLSDGEEEEPTSFEEPQWGMKVVTEYRNGLLQVPPSIFALIASELILNAADYLKKNEASIEAQLGRMPSIDLFITGESVAVKNTLLVGSENAVRVRIEDHMNRPGRSLSKIAAWAQIANCNVEVSAMDASLVITVAHRGRGQ